MKFEQVIPINSDLFAVDICANFVPGNTTHSDPSFSVILIIKIV